MISRRILMFAALVLVVGAGATGFVLFKDKWESRNVPVPPVVSSSQTDRAVTKVIEQYRDKVLANPTNSNTWGELGMAFDAHSETSQAAECYRQAMKLDDSNDARWPYLLAGKLDRGGGNETEEAIQLYRKAIDLSPPTPAHRTVAILSLADLLTELGRGDEATPLYERAYNAEMNSPWAAYRMGMVLSKRGETNRAARIFLSLAPNAFARKKSAIAMAELSRRIGNLKDAEGFDYAAGLLPPDNHWANPFTAPLYEIKRGRRALMDRYVMLEASQSERAAVQTANALADQYPSVETQMILLRAMVNASEFQAAVSVADDIMRDEEGRKLVTAHSFLGLARMGLADRAEAEGRKVESDRLLAQAAESLGESVRLKPDFALGHMYQARALMRLGKLAEAEKAARAGVASRPEEWEGYLALVEVLSAAGRKEDAIRTAEQAVKLAHPNEPRPKSVLEKLKK